MLQGNHTAKFYWFLQSHSVPLNESIRTGAADERIQAGPEWRNAKIYNKYIKGRPLLE